MEDKKPAKTTRVAKKAKRIRVTREHDERGLLSVLSDGVVDTNEPEGESRKPLPGGIFERTVVSL